MAMHRIETAPDLRDAGRLWWVPLSLGIAWIIVSLGVLQFDITSVTTIAVLTGVVLLAVGLNEALEVFVSTGWRWMHAVLAVLFLAGGIAALVWPGPTFATLARLIGWYLLFKGTADLVMSLALKHVMPMWGLTLAVGIVEIALAFWVVGYPSRSAALLVLWVGIGALVKGVTNIVLAFQLRGLRVEAPTAPVAPAVPAGGPGVPAPREQAEAPSAGRDVRS
jgi:uncharacterized membrane protein HdeD (DUF308 family)